MGRIGFVALAAVIALVATAAPARTLSGRVTQVLDGDTVSVAGADGRVVRVRLAGIDAPEHAQRFGRESRDNLASFLGGRTVTVDWHKRDRYGRIVGTVRRGRDSAGLWQVYTGHAWHYRFYAGEQAPGDRAAYAAAEADARKARRGLWADARPQPPWTWRRSRSEARR